MEELATVEVDLLFLHLSFDTWMMASLLLVLHGRKRGVKACEEGSKTTRRE